MAIRYFPFTTERYAMAMGVKPLEPADWIEPGEEAAWQLPLRSRLIAEHRDTVLAITPAAEAAAIELHGVLTAHLAQHWPQLYRRDGGDLVVAATGTRSPLTVADGATALAAIGSLVQEDIALLSPAPPVVLEAGVVCFPSRWSLRDKLGKASDAIHAPVPGFAAIARPTAQALEKLSPSRPLWRLNWTIHDSDHLFCPGPMPGRSDLTRDTVIDACWLRCERQTLRRLPGTGHVVFTIRTYLTPLREVIADPDRHRLVRATLRDLPEAMAAYKGMGAYFAVLKEAL